MYASLSLDCLYPRETHRRRDGQLVVHEPRGVPATAVRVVCGCVLLGAAGLGGAVGVQPAGLLHGHRSRHAPGLCGAGVTSFGAVM